MTDANNKVFNYIAPGWYNYRHHTIFRHELEELAELWRNGKLLNLGCGHGPDFLPFKDNFELYGIDISTKMIELAHTYADKYSFKATLSVGDMAKLPYKDTFFNYAIAVASIHHLDNPEARRNALSELYRVLKPGGRAFITVWNRHQPRFWLKKKDTTVPWRQSDGVLLRYYHLFSYGELARLARDAGFIIVNSFPEYSFSFPIKYFSRNICLLVERK